MTWLPSIRARIQELTDERAYVLSPERGHWRQGEAERGKGRKMLGSFEATSCVSVESEGGDGRIGTLKIKDAGTASGAGRTRVRRSRTGSQHGWVGTKRDETF